LHPDQRFGKNLFRIQDPDPGSGGQKFTESRIRNAAIKARCNWIRIEKKSTNKIGLMEPTINPNPVMLKLSRTRNPKDLKSNIMHIFLKKYSIVFN
jgi:hypothetical protein